MSQEVITRVDEMVRRNNIRYKDEQQQKAYEQALKQYEKHNQKQIAKQYASIVKEGNRKAIQKAKEVKAIANKKTKKKVSVVEVPKQDRKIENIKPKVSEAEIAMFNKTVSARAERLLQEQQLQKLNKQLNEERKRTKLHELNEKCKQMLSKSHERIVPARGVSTEKMGVLKQMEDRAFGQIMELDNIINDLVDRANQQKNVKRIERPKSTLNLQRKQNREMHVLSNNDEDQEDQDQHIFLDKDLLEAQKQPSENEEQELSFEKGNFDNFLSLNTIIFQKSTEQLLNMPYLPL